MKFGNSCTFRNSRTLAVVAGTGTAAAGTAAAGTAAADSHYNCSAIHGCDQTFRWPMIPQLEESSQVEPSFFHTQRPVPIQVIIERYCSGCK